MLSDVQIYKQNFVIIYVNVEIMTTKEILKEIGRNIKCIREERNILQQDLAAMCNFEVSAMSRIEAGGSNFTVGTLNKIATALGVPVKDLFR